MSQRTYDIRIGTSGWHYDHWYERFYPRDIPKKDWLQYYVQHFNTVEINNTFYRLPRETMVERWHELAPKDFLFTVKANRFVTHVKRLRDAEEPLRNFFDAIRPLAKNLGPILYQLSPTFHKDLGRLEDFIQLLPGKIPGVFEFRHNSWFTDDVLQLLDDSGLGLCIHDLGGVDVPRVVTANIIYLRFHDPPGEFSHDYPPHMLRQWAKWARENLRTGRRLFAYFNNDYNACAVRNAQQLREFLTK
jgi:uncharacterized protein YecE (DUF72 family)